MRHDHPPLPDPTPDYESMEWETFPSSFSTYPWTGDKTTAEMDDDEEEAHIAESKEEKYPFELKDCASLRQARWQLDDKEWGFRAADIIRDMMDAAQLVLATSGEFEKAGNRDYNNAIWGLRAAIMDAEMIGMGE